MAEQKSSTLTAVSLKQRSPPPGSLSPSSRTLSASMLRERLLSLSTPMTEIGDTLKAHIDFVPIRVPRKRRLQLLAVAAFSVMIPCSIAFFIFLCSFPPLWPFLAAYMIWIHFIDTAPVRGGRPSRRFRALPWFQYIADYYPASIVKEANLPPDRPYVFGYHPHGIIGMGAIATFSTEGTGFSRLYPGLKIPHLLTLSSNFFVPFSRDVLMALGIGSVSKKSCTNILSEGPGSSITIVVGGATESLAAHPGTADLTLRRRLGFIKVAIQHGADLVPVFSFGENDIFHQMPNQPGTSVHKLQKKFQALFGFTLPLFHGRGLFNYNLGLMPYRRRIVAVIGRPIHVTKNKNPSLQEVQQVQSEYIDELLR
ncbi:diacylglycerol acyltransferase-domain-containing protein [Flagelloscypha sp. PMI_526]|nr:diacylglycerol acyltransferase-domain-containing protein [Flagelloscypha sp. PMI_526]